jgi:uncharacterized Fe-S center protein
VGFSVFGLAEEQNRGSAIKVQRGQQSTGDNVAAAVKTAIVEKPASEDGASLPQWIVSTANAMSSSRRTMVDGTQRSIAFALS